MSSELCMIKANFVAIMVGRRQKAKEETFEIIGVHILDDDGCFLREHSPLSLDHEIAYYSSTLLFCSLTL
jgi:hypothetical protein